MTEGGPPSPGAELSATDLAVDHRLSLLAQSFRFLLDITPVDADDLRDDFLAGREPDPPFTYRELETDPAVVRAELDDIDLTAVEDPVLGQLLRAKHREMELQLDMLEARDTDDFLPLSVELYGGVSPSLRRQAEALLSGITRTEPTDEPLDAEAFLALAEAEIARYHDEDPDLDMHAEIRPDVNGVMVSGDVLLIGPETKVQQARAAGAAPPRGGHPPRHPGQRQPPADQGPRRRARGLRRDAGGSRRPRRDRLRRADRLPPAPARQPRRHRPPPRRRARRSPRPTRRWSPTTSRAAARGPP